MNMLCFAMRNNPRKTTQIGVRLDVDTRRKLEALANKERRSVSDLVRVLIHEALSRKRAA